MTKFIEVGFVYDIQPPRIHPISSEELPASIQFILDFDIPETLWEECKDNEDQLIQKSIQHILVPSLVNYSERLEANLDSNEN